MKPAREEAALQAACEKILEIYNFRRLTAKGVVEARSSYGRPRGFYGHLSRAVGNALMPDLFIFDARGRCLLVEIKAGKPRWRPGQKELCDMGYWTWVNSVTAFSAALGKWCEAGAGAGRG